MAGLDEADSLDENTMEEDLPDEVAASKEPVEQTVVEVDGMEDFPAEFLKAMEHKFKIAFNKQKMKDSPPAGTY